MTFETQRDPGDECEFKPTHQTVAHIVHGKTCPKVSHVGTGYLHSEDDDTPYDVDGARYCGRCHVGL